MKLSSESPEATEAIGRRIGEHIADGTTVGLVGCLGAGKTCLTRGIAAGLGIDPDLVASPTFVYLVDLAAPKGRRLNHADLYRLEDTRKSERPDSLRDIGLLDATRSSAVTVIEWWQYWAGPEPDRLLTVEFFMENLDHRLISLTSSPEMGNSIENWFGGFDTRP